MKVCHLTPSEMGNNLTTLSKFTEQTQALLQCECGYMFCYWFRRKLPDPDEDLIENKLYFLKACGVNFSIW